MNSAGELHMAIYLFNKISYSPVISNKYIISKSPLQHFKPLRSHHLRKSKPMLILVLLRALRVQDLTWCMSTFLTHCDN